MGQDRAKTPRSGGEGTALGQAPMTTAMTGRESAMLTDVTLSQIPELSEFVDDDNANADDLLADDSEFDLLRRDCEQGHATSFASEHGQSSTEVKHTDIKLDFDSRTQSAKLPSTRQPQTQIPRIRAGALDTVTNTKIHESQRKDGGIAGKLVSYSQRLPSLHKTIFPTNSTISDEPMSTRRSGTPTPEPTILTPTEPDETAIHPLPTHTHAPTHSHPDMPSHYPLTEHPPQGSGNNVENDEEEELEVADITITIADADSDSNLPPSNHADNTNMDSNSLLTQSLGGEHVKLVFSPMRRGTKRSIDPDEAAGDGNRKEDSEVDEQVCGETDMDGSDTEKKTDLHMGVRLGSKKRSGQAEKHGQTKGGRTRAVQGGRTENRKDGPLQKKGKIPESPSVKTLPAKRAKYVPRSASASTTSITSTVASTSNMPTNAAMTAATKVRIRSGAGEGKAVGASHLTQLREAHRRLGIAKSERAVLSSASGSGTTGGRVGVRRSSRSVSGSLHQRRAQPAVGKEIGPSRAGSSVLENEREKEPWVGVRAVHAAGSRTDGAKSAVHLTKPVPFTFRVDARARRVVTDPWISELGLKGGSGGGGAIEKNKGKNREDDGLKKLMLLESDHGESWLHRPEECALSSLASSSGTSTSAAVATATTQMALTTIPRPFAFTTALRATERAKFDALMRQKQEEMARVREEARKRAEEEMARVVREMRRRAVPKAHEVPEWYKEMPRKGQGMG
ncbi:hypothetical protein EDD17DRAFT_1626659 [Pisolithus thermaeus]|nr:hypothetical protein EDD17DRAFT_1626659 [Pisolithus thermaeus]